MADKLIPPWKNRPTPLQPLGSIALSYPPRGNGGSFPSLARQMTFEFLETRGVVENGRRPRRAGIKGRFYLSISPFGREFARIRDFEILRHGFSPSSRYPPSSRFKNPTLPDFFNISAGWKGMSKWANHFVSWIVGLRGGRLDESCRGHFDEGSNCGNVSFLFFFFCRAPFVVPVFARDSGIDGNVVQPDARFYLLWWFIVTRWISQSTFNI